MKKASSKWCQFKNNAKDKNNPRYLYSVDGKAPGQDLGLAPTKLQTDSTGFTLESVIHIGCSSYHSHYRTEGLLSFFKLAHLLRV